MASVRRKVLETFLGDDSLSIIMPPTFTSRRRGRWNAFKVEGLTTKQVRDTMWHLRDKDLISYTEDQEGVVTITLTEAGERKALSYQLDEMTLQTPKRWDGKWRLILFDIPEKQKQARDAFTETMKRLGLYMFQRSVWVYPYGCKDEIDFVAEVFEVGRYVHYMVVDKATNEHKLRARFGLQRPHPMRS